MFLLLERVFVGKVNRVLFDDGEFFGVFYGVGFLLGDGEGYG